MHNIGDRSTYAELILNLSDPAFTRLGLYLDWKLLGKPMLDSLYSNSHHRRRKCESRFPYWDIIFPAIEHEAFLRNICLKCLFACLLSSSILQLYTCTSSMPAKDRKSPRDSIKQWLFATSEKQPATSNDLCAQGSLTRQRNVDEKKVHHRRSTESRRKDDSHAGSFETRWQSTVENTAGRFTAHISSARPNLHAPIRNLTYDSEVPVEERNQIQSPRKRRRTDTRRSPSLEPAATVDLAARERESDVDVRYSQELSRGRKRKQLATTNSPSPSTSAHLSPLRPSGESYRKRRRHKTRDDRFTLKAARRTGEQSEKEHDPVRKPTKRRRAEKTGAALVHEFNASNVPQERLTVRCLFPIRTDPVSADKRDLAKRVACTWSICKRKGVISDDTAGL